MRELLRKYRVFLFAGGLLLAAFMVYSLNLRNKEHANIFEQAVLTVMSPVTEVVAGANRFVVGFWSDYIALVDVERENRILRDTVKVLRSRIVADQEAVLSAERLKRLLALRDTLRVPAVAATVVGEDGYPWFKTILIDRGETDGLREGMAVVAADGVVGQVVKVAPGSSRVLLFTDHASGIAATVQRSRARGVVKGKGGGRSTLEFTMRDEDVKVGDTVVTSGIGQLFPKGLTIGDVTMVKKGEYGIFQSIEVRPAVNLFRLEEVLVLLHVPG